MFDTPYLATVTIFAGNFAPRGWAYCNGDLLSISANEALFALIGTTYGGDGINTFALPDLRSRIAIHTGPGFIIGQMAGQESTTMTLNQMPSHTHVAVAITGGQPGSTSTTNNLNTPANNVPAATAANLYSASNDGLGLGPSVGQTVTVITGSSQPIETISPYVGMNYIIATEGIFPSQS